jgi:hypothetical protein
LKEICNGYDIDLTLVWIGDVHFENYLDANGVGTPTAWNPQIQWIVDNIMTYNIKAVLCAGDIESFKPFNLTFAQTLEQLSQQLALAWSNNDGRNGLVTIDNLVAIDNFGLPYLVTIGNHDYPNINDPTETPSPRDTSDFDSQLGYGRINSRKWYVDYWPDPSSNTKATQAIQFTVGNRNFLVISLELWPRNPALKWVEGKIEQYSDHEVIIITHAFMKPDGSFEESVALEGTLTPCQDDTDDKCGKYGNLLWTWAKQFTNVRAIMCGHECDPLAAPGKSNSHASGPNEAFTTLTATDGHTVLGIYSNHQSDYSPNSPGDPSYSPSYSQVVLLLHLLSDKSHVVIRSFNTTTGKEIINSYYYPSGLPNDSTTFPKGASPSNVFPVVLPWYSPKLVNGAAAFSKRDT